MNHALAGSKNVFFQDEHPCLHDGRREILAGLRAQQKYIEPKWLYDERGSELFDEITRLPEYYPTRTEMRLLEARSGEISEHCGHSCLFIEPGSGSSEKVRLLLDDLRPQAYVPVDISADFLKRSALALGGEYPWLEIHAVCADFNGGWDFLDSLPTGRRVVFYPGSTIGNLEPAQAEAFLASLAAVIGADGGALIGVDTHKDSATLHAAYNDSAGVTAAFNLNLLARLNVLLDAEFDLDCFEHRAFYNEGARRIEMHLVSLKTQTVRCADDTVSFESGETIHTENSYKYSPENFGALAARAGLKVEHSWLDDRRLFSLHYLRARD